MKRILRDAGRAPCWRGLAAAGAGSAVDGQRPGWARLPRQAGSVWKGICPERSRSAGPRLLANDSTGKINSRKCNQNFPHWATRTSQVSEDLQRANLEDVRLPKAFDPVKKESTRLSFSWVSSVGAVAPSYARPQGPGLGVLKDLVR